MKELIIRTYRPGETISQPHFYVLNKGIHAGHPSKKQIWVNCFVVIGKDEMTTDRAYWICYALWQGKKFSILLRGSVVEFIRLDDLKHLLNKYHNSNIPEEKLNKMIKAFNDIEQYEINALAQLKTIKELKQTLLQKIEVAHR